MLEMAGFVEASATTWLLTSEVSGTDSISARQLGVEITYAILRNTDHAVEKDLFTQTYVRL